MKNEDNPFASREFLFLSWLGNHQSIVGGKSVVRFSQKELADEFGCCETTINKCLSVLRQTGCIEPIKKGNYFITKRGNEVIAEMEKIKQIIAGGASC